MSARSRTAAGSRERGWSREVPEVFCENNPCIKALAPVPSVSPMVSVLCLAEFLQCFSSHESCVTGCHSFHRFFGSTFLHTSGSRQASNHDRTASASLFLQDTRVCWSLLDYPSQFNIRATTAPRRRRCAEQLQGPSVTVKINASSRLSGHRAR